jgi:hypothetical protein
MYGY